MNGERDALGNLVTGEVPITQRVGCSFVSGEVIPMQALADMHVRCRQCGTESVLLTWMRENKIAQFENIPSELRVWRQATKAVSVYVGCSHSVRMPQTLQ